MDLDVGADKGQIVTLFSREGRRNRGIEPGREIYAYCERMFA